jgi:hypothetical protein
MTLSIHSPCPIRRPLLTVTVYQLPLMGVDGGDQSLMNLPRHGWLGHYSWWSVLQLGSSLVISIEPSYLAWANIRGLLFQYHVNIMYTTYAHNILTLFLHYFIVTI